jgi:enoyl-CoA hydratase
MSQTPEYAGFEVKQAAPSVLLIRFTRPADRNPLSISTLNDLKTVLPSWLNSDRITAIIFTGSLDVFASGANIRELAQLDSQSARRFADLGQQLWQSVACAQKKTIAAINGYCIGGGLDLALACDFRVASNNARFGHPGARLGIITGWGGTQRLPHLIGKARALELFVTANSFNAIQAHRIGLVDRVVDDAVQAALDLALLRS